jgi:hypothetical protein
LVASGSPPAAKLARVVATRCGGDGLPLPLPRPLPLPLPLELLPLQSTPPL